MEQLSTRHTSAYFLSDDSPVSNLIGILNLLSGEITLCGTDAAAIRVPIILLIWILWRCSASGSGWSIMGNFPGSPA